MAFPRLSPAGAPLPQPLAADQADRLRRIFALQARGNIRAAADATAGLDLSVTVQGVRIGQAMFGHVLADRYLGRYTHPGADDLRAWLRDHAALPDAPAIYSLLLARLPRGAKPPPAPTQDALGADTRTPVPEEATSARLALNRTASLDRAVWDEARTGKPGAAERLLSHLTGPGRDYVGQLRGEAAQILFTLNRDEEAYDVAAPAAAACSRRRDAGCRNAAMPGYEAGLAAWRMHRPDLARPMFEAAWRAELTTPTLRAAAAFWAARAHLQTEDPGGYVPWMTRAAAEANTFYGLIARRALGLGIGFAPGGRRDRELLSVADTDAMMAYPAGVRAFALLQIGQPDRAEAELRLLWPDAAHAPALGRAIMLVAGQAGLTDLAAQLADLVQTADGRPRDALRFPIPHVRPDGGFIIDPPLLYAMARAESEFTTGMVSGAGALGMMQVMPQAAAAVLGRASSATQRALTSDPGFNLDIGQRYFTYLASLDGIGNDLVHMLAGYNAGPGNLARWSQTIRDGDDPLLYIEAIPLAETRAYVPRVLTYAWIYATRMRLPMPGLDELAAGAWPRQTPRARVQEAAARLH